MKKRLLSLALALAMLLTLLPAGALAAGEHTCSLAGVSQTFKHALTNNAEGQLLKDGVVLAPTDGSIQLPPVTDGYYMESDVTLGSDLEIDTAGGNLCLNDRTLDMNRHRVNINAGKMLTVTCCGAHNGTITNHGPAIDVRYSLSNLFYGTLVVESGKITNTDAESPFGAIMSSGYVTLKSGEVTGPYGVYLNHQPYDYNQAMLTLSGWPKVSGTKADIRLIDSNPTVSAIPLIDATYYTGEPLDIEFAVSIGSDKTLADRLGTPIVKLGSTPASKFSLTNEGYTLKERTVDGAKCLVLAEKSATQAKWGVDAEHLTEEGTLEVALAAARTDSTVGYIRLVDDVTAADGEAHIASTGTFTLDLNGHTLTGGKGRDNFPGYEGLYVGDATVTVTNTADKKGTIQGGPGGAANSDADNCGGPGVTVSGGKLTVDSNGVDSNGVTITAGQPGANYTGQVSTPTALLIKDGEAVLKGGFFDASQIENGIGSRVNRGTVNIAGGSFLGRSRGLQVDNAAAQVSLSGGAFAGGDRAVELGPNMTYANLLAGGYGWSENGHVLLSATEAELATKRTLAVIPLPHTHAVSADCSTETGTQVEFTAWASDTSLPETAGNYYLTKDVTLSEKWTPPADTTLCLNGHRVIGSGPQTIFIDRGQAGALDLCDCQESGSVSNSRERGNAIVLMSGVLHLYGGTVTSKMRGVTVEPNTTFHMHGGSVKGVTDSNTEVGVYVSDSGTFRMDGGTISGNQKGVAVTRNSTFQVAGDVVINGNTAANVEISGDSPMELSGALGLGAEIGLGLWSWSDVTAGNPVLAVQGAGERTVSQTDLAKLFCDSDQYQLKLDGGKVYFVPKPTAMPTPSTQPTVEPSGAPSTTPTAKPSTAPSTTPTATPSTSPSGSPSTTPTTKPSTAPSTTPTEKPSTTPSGTPSTTPTAKPSTAPTAKPSGTPSTVPTTKPSEAPSTQPSTEPSTAPSATPSAKPSAAPGGGYRPGTSVVSKPTSTPAGTALPFSDVAATDPYYEAVKTVFEKGWMVGTSETTFDPGGPLTRGMLAVILYRQAGSPKVEGSPEFADTGADTWYADAIAWAVQTQVLRGYGNGKFGPEDQVSEEMLDMIIARQKSKDPSWTGDPRLAIPTTRAETAFALVEGKKR